MISFRSLFASAWMGIQHDLAWTSPPAALVLRTVAPFASAMTVSIIYWFGVTHSGLTFDPARLAFILVGSTLYAHVASYAWVPTIAIAEGKNLSVFPHIYLTARSTALYVAGRALSSFAISSTTSLAALAVAYYVLSGFLQTTIILTITPASLLMLAVALFANIPAALGLGYFLGAYSLYASKFEWSLPGYVAGLLMVFSGALFSTSILPWGVSTVASYLPFTLFIQASRDALIYGNLGDYLTSLGLCILGGVGLLLVSLWVYLAAERRARRDGVLDRRLA
ncbi:MAG: hypothetical protein HY297_02785 [Thaumarchaeota archaeon]|nr:hypothetical protein [Nitrososphaerota archaeon]